MGFGVAAGVAAVSAGVGTEGVARTVAEAHAGAVGLFAGAAGALFGAGGYGHAAGVKCQLLLHVNRGAHDAEGVGGIKGGVAAYVDVRANVVLAGAGAFFFGSGGLRAGGGVEAAVNSNQPLAGPI